MKVCVIMYLQMRLYKSLSRFECVCVCVCVCVYVYVCVGKTILRVYVFAIVCLCLYIGVCIFANVYE